MKLQAIDKLIAILKQLRDPITGCDWDKVQTFDSITSCTLEETYEVLDTIKQKNYPELQKELGDLLFQIVFYAELADEQKLFNFDDVCQAICDKLIQRHPHIFSENKRKVAWETLKQQERNQKKQFSILDDIPLSMPALMRAEKVQKRCASVGFDWNTLPPVVDKVKEELEEVMIELNRENPIKKNIEEEIGDLLFATVNLARHLGLHSEFILQQAIHKFTQRFNYIETYFNNKNQALSDITLEEMESVWQQAKQHEKQKLK